MIRRFSFFIVMLFLAFGNVFSLPPAIMIGDTTRPGRPFAKDLHVILSPPTGVDKAISWS